MSTPNGELIKKAAFDATFEGRPVEAAALEGLARLFTMEIIRCLDPRHPTTAEQADAAVAQASPYDDVLKAIREEAASRGHLDP